MFDTYHVVLTASTQNLLRVLCLSSIVRAISHKVLFFLSTTPFWEAYMDSKIAVQDPSHDKRFRNEIIADHLYGFFVPFVT
jgi:hypothetical protein